MRHSDLRLCQPQAKQLDVSVTAMGSKSRLVTLKFPLVCDVGIFLHF